MGTTLSDMELDAIRRRSLAVLADEAGGQDALAHALDVSGSYISQLMTSARPISEKTARKYEQRLGKPAGWMDVDHAALRAAIAPAQVSDLVNVLLSLSPAERAYWVRVIGDHPRSS